MSYTTYVLKFSFPHWIKRCKEPSCPRSPGLGIWRTLEVPDWGILSRSGWGWVYNVPNYLCFEIQLSTLNKKVQRTLMSLKSWSFVGLWRFLTGVSVPDDDGERWTMSQTVLQSSAFYIELKGAKNPHVLEILVWICGGLWKFLTSVVVPDHDCDRSRMSQTTYDSKFSFLH